jgi:hypothetical protein
MFAFGCSNNGDDQETLPPQQTFDLGITTSNMYPNWPDTWSMGLGDNEWDNWKKGDTLYIHKRIGVSDDSGDDVYYTFLVKPRDHIRPLRIRWTSNDKYANPPRNNAVILDVPIQNFRLQQYIENNLLVCETNLPLYYNGVNYPMIDRMWVELK